MCALAGHFVSDIAIFVLKRDVKLQLTNLAGHYNYNPESQKRCGHISFKFGWNCRYGATDMTHFLCWYVKRARSRDVAEFRLTQRKINLKCPQIVEISSLFGNAVLRIQRQCQNFNRKFISSALVWRSIVQT